jgi:multicomponent K+:H+ antiporter subunit G
LSDLLDIVASLLLLIGLGFTLVGSIGLVRLPDFYTRMHAPTKATTLGVSSIFAAAALTLPGAAAEIAFKAVLVIALLFITAPIGAHMLARAARHGRIPHCPQTHVDELPPAPHERAGEEAPRQPAPSVE